MRHVVLLVEAACSHHGSHIMRAGQPVSREHFCADGDLWRHHCNWESGGAPHSSGRRYDDKRDIEPQPVSASPLERKSASNLHSHSDQRFQVVPLGFRPAKCFGGQVLAPSSFWRSRCRRAVACSVSLASSRPTFRGFRRRPAEQWELISERAGNHHPSVC